MTFTLVVVVKDQAEYEAFDRSHVEGAELVFVRNLQREPLARIGNRYLNEPGELLGLVHADVILGSGSLLAFGKAAASGAVVGIVGKCLDDLYRWCHANPGMVSTLDCCSVFLRKDLGLRFDEETFDGLHCHVPDLCLQAQRAGIPVTVPAADATHYGSYGKPGWEAWQEEYYGYQRRLENKWRGTAFKTT